MMKNDMKQKRNTSSQEPKGNSTSITQVKRGDIYFARITDGEGSEQSGTRPVLVLQNDVGNRFSPTTIVAFMTTKHKTVLPIHQELPKDISKLDEDSIIMFEQIRTISKSRLIRKVSTLDARFMEQMNDKIMISLGIITNF
jgi:mRNA interferase MazF